MRRIALAAAVAAALAVLPGGASAAGCSPLNCAPSQLPLAGGRLLAVRAAGIDGNVRVLDLRTGRTRWWLPSGMFGGNLLVHADGSLVTWFDAATGARVTSGVASLHGRFALVGASQDGRRAVLARTQKLRTTFVIFSPAGQRQVVLGGNQWSFDALAGDRLYLLHFVLGGYEVRLYDLGRNRLVRRPLKDPGESDVISGVAWQRAASVDGRYLFTLYVSDDGHAMVHELDVRAGSARCIDLPGGGDFAASITYALALAPDGRTLWAISPALGQVAAIDVAAHRLRTHFAFAGSQSQTTSALAAMDRSGRRLAVTDASHVWVVEPARHRVVRSTPGVALAVGFSPDGGRLWLVGQRSRVSSLPIR